MSRESYRNALFIQHCYSPYRTTQFEKTIKKRQKGPVLAIKGPFGDLGGPRRTPGDQIWSQRPPIGPSGLESCSPHTLTWYRAPSGPLGALKGTVLARNAPFGALGGPRGARFGPDCPQLARLGRTHAHHTLVSPHLVSGPFWAPGGPKRARFGPKCPFWGPRRSPGGQIWSQLPPIGPPWLDSCSPHT